MSDSQTLEPRTLRSSVRNPRRRQRQSDADSVKSAPGRKRSKISENTFMPPRHDEEEEVVNGSIETPPMMMNGDIQEIQPTSTGRSRGRARRGSASAMDVEMPLRAKKSSVKRPTRGDGATVLTQNERYSLKLLPSTPHQLRREGVEYTGSLGAAHHALAVTRERAYIWDYTSHTPVNTPRTFDVPFTLKPTDPLPLGTLVAAGNSSDVGLLLVSAANGNVVYYESIERAASLSLFQERKAGVEGSLGSLFSGETVVDLVSAEHAGYIAILSSGRVVHFTLRDAQGKARILAQYLRATEQSTGGFFGSIKGMITGGGWKRDVAAVHTRSLGPRGPIQAISLTERAELQIWEFGWGGQYNFNGTIDCREAVLGELKKSARAESEGQAEGMATLDFALLERPSNGKELNTPGADVPLDLLMLVRDGPPNDCKYVLVELSIVGLNAAVIRVLQLNSYHQRARLPNNVKPRLLIPKPQRTALVMFEDAMLLAELGQAEADGPEAQLHASLIRSASFEDTIYLKQSPPYDILDATTEDLRPETTSGIAFVKGAGLVRVSIADSSQIARLPTIPVKTKIEQAVFHGALQDANIVDFSRVGDSMYKPEDVERAALQLSDEIVSSKSPFITTSPTSIEAHLAHKSQALRALVVYLRQNYPTLSKAALWRLLWDAEKVASAQQIWKVFEEHKAANSERRQKRAATLIDEVCAMAQLRDSNDSNEPDVPSNEDAVRRYFVHRVQHVDKLLIYTYNFMKMLQNDNDHSSLAKVRLVLEANDLWNKSLEAVFSFREHNAAAYGILPEFLDEGILTDLAEYTELPEFWTSSESMLKAAVNMCKISRSLATTEYEKDDQDPDLANIVPLVGQENPRLIQLMCLIYQERINWLASREDAKRQDLAEQMRMNYEETRCDQFRGLAEVAQSQAGLKLAEKYRDMHTLTEIIVAEMQFAFEELATDPPEQQRKAITAHMDDMTAKISTLR